MKFKVGEIAILHSIRRWIGSVDDLPCEVDIIEVGPFVAGHRYSDGYYTPMDADYRVITPSGTFVSVKEWQLRKRPERGIPKEVREIFENPIEVEA
jgi:hypothetical protein